MILKYHYGLHTNLLLEVTHFEGEEGGLQSYLSSRNQTHYQINTMVNVDWDTSKMTKFTFMLSLEHIRFMKHPKAPKGPSMAPNIMMFQVSTDM